ncbi:M20 family metallopeptidase [Halobacteriaceae archaeon GCM10025711]
MPAALDAFLDDHEADLVAATEDLVGIDSQNPPGDTRDAVAYLRDRFEALGLEPETVAVDDEKPNLLVTLPGERDATLLFNGHLDTVPFDSGEWTFDPLGEREGDRLYGRGTNDMKGAVAAMLLAVRAYVETGTTPPVTLRFAFVSDEETGGEAGLSALLERGLLDADAAVIGETTCERGRHSVTVADRGSIWLTLEATGVAAHGSRPPLGENAIDRLLDAVEDVRSFLRTDRLTLEPTVESIVEESVAFYETQMDEATARRLFEYPSVNLGVLRGGHTINQVPESARAKLDVRVAPAVDTADILAEIRAILDDHDGVEVAAASRSVGTYEPVDAPVVAATVDVAEAVTGERIYRRSATGGGDAKKLRNAGVSTVEFALGTDTMHAVDEYTSVEALAANAAVYARLPYAFVAALDGTGAP